MIVKSIGVRECRVTSEVALCRRCLNLVAESEGTATSSRTSSARSSAFWRRPGVASTRDQEHVDTFRGFCQLHHHHGTGALRLQVFHSRNHASGTESVRTTLNRGERAAAGANKF